MSKRTWITNVGLVFTWMAVTAVSICPASSRAGETTTVATTTTTPGVPGVQVSVRVLDPGLLPAATELEDRLLYHLRHLTHLLSPVLAGPTTSGDSVPVTYILNVQLDPVTNYPVRVVSARSPFGRTEPAQALFISQVPLQGRVTVQEKGGRQRVVAQTVLTVQSSGFTITAGTTKPAADLMAEKIVHYLKTQRRRGGFLDAGA